MPAGSAFDIVVASRHFTPGQILPKALAEWSMEGFSRWTLEHFGGWDRLIREYRTGMVMVGGSVEYVSSWRFLDGPRLHARPWVYTVRGDKLLHLDVDVGAGWIEIDLWSTASGQIGASETREDSSTPITRAT